MKIHLRGPAALLASVAAGVLLSACSILPEAQPVDVYMLPASAGTPASGGKALDLSLRVVRPTGTSRLAGTRIAVVPQDNLFSVYQGVRWSDPTPQLLRNRLLDAFRSNGRIAALSSDEQNLHADYELGGELLAFQSEYRSGVAEASICFDALLVQAGTRRIIASRRFEVRQPAEGNAVPQVVQAFGKAGDVLSSQVANWTIEQLTVTH